MIETKKQLKEVINKKRMLYLGKYGGFLLKNYDYVLWRYVKIY